MAKEIRVSRDMIDSTLEVLTDDVLTRQDAPYQLPWFVTDALRWYIFTGRASVDWIIALSKANPHKLITHLFKAERTEEAICEACTNYLARHCGLSR